MARTPISKTTKRADLGAPAAPPASAGNPSDNATARAADTLLNIMMLTGAGTALARTGSELVNRLGRTRGSSFYAKQREPNLEARVQPIALPYLKGAQDPGDVPGGGIFPRPRGRMARMGRNIDPAANMRALGAKPLPTDPNLAAAQRAQTIAANLAKTQANRAKPGYMNSFSRTNVNPIGQLASNYKPTSGAQPLGPAFRGGPSTPAPSRSLATPKPGASPFGSSPRVSAAVGMAPPTPTPTTPIPAGATKMAEGEPGPPSALAKGLVDAVGLTRGPGPDAGGFTGMLRDWLNPADATSVAQMPWFLGALPAAAATGAMLGYKPVDAAFKGLRKSEDKAEYDEVKARYHNALRAAALTKSGSAGLDAAYEAAEKRGFLEVPIGALAMALGGAGTAGAYHGWTKERAASSAKVLDAALKQRRSELMTRMPRSYAVRPEPVTAQQQRKALQSLMSTPDAEEEL